MSDFEFSPSIRAFFDQLQKRALPGVWSKGLTLARDGRVILDSYHDEEMVGRVQKSVGSASVKVSLWPEDDDYFCECDEKADPCSHVAALAAFLKLQKSQGASLSIKISPIVYRFRAEQNPSGAPRLVFERLVNGQALGGSLSALPKDQIAPTPEDLAIDRCLASSLSESSQPSDRALLERLFPLLKNAGPVEWGSGKITIGPPQVAIQAEVREDGPGFRLLATENPEVETWFENGVLLSGGQFRLMKDPALTSEEKQLLRAPGRFFSTQEVQVLVSDILPRLEKKIPVTVKTNRLTAAAEASRGITLSCQKMGEHELEVTTQSDGSLDSRELLRTLQSELHLSIHNKAYFTGLNAIEFISKAQALTQKNSEKIRILGEGLEYFRVHDPLSMSLHSEITSDGAQLRVHFQSSQKTAEPHSVLQAWKEGASLVPLLGGGYAPLPKEALDRHGKIIERLLAFQERGAKKLPRYFQYEIEALHQELDLSWAHDFSGIQETELPADLQASLRDYQKQGVNWLCFLRDSGMGALLADDMGLGKTLQALCSLQGRTLIVVPTSVIQSWADQIQKFRPGLKTQIYWGSQRKLDSSADVTITSYGLLRSDPLILDQAWDCAILDEAQTIKNPESQIARSAHQIRAQFRLALSGTPVENRLEDLWSQFQFINPGLLGSRRDFQEEWASPIQRGSTETAERLRKRLKPFILRRLKSEVARELPPKTEMIAHCDLSESERALYDALKDSTQKEVLERLERGESIFSIFELLLRLRQASCHPALIPGQTALSSSKVDLLLENLETTVAEGHRALVFSQWTSLLDLIEKPLKDAGIEYLRLDGSTSDRSAVVSSFQSPSGPPVLLLSLKAGGVGITLTAADHVFFMDSWWNPAVEDQAADRVHRIGQEKPVIICRLVTRNTIEEKILALQIKKQALAKSLIQSTDASPSSALTKEDLLELVRS